MLAFPFAITLAATTVAALWGERLLAIFGPEFISAKPVLVILKGCQLARVIFGPSVPLLTGARKKNTALAVNRPRAQQSRPLYGVIGSAIAVVIATLFWLVGCAVAQW